jgi:predicted TIM-barrel fold metal-dependent hydrolase
MMEIVDPHHHLWDLDRNYYPWLCDPASASIFYDHRPLQGRNYRLADYLADFAAFRLLKSVHLEATHDPDDPVRETAWVQSVADDPGSRGFPHGIVVAGNLADPRIAEQLERHAESRNVRGLRQSLNLHSDPRYNLADKDYLKDETWNRNFALIEKANLSFDLQLYYYQMRYAAPLVQRWDRVQFVVTHAGFPIKNDPDGRSEWREGMLQLAKYRNVWVKISGFGMFDPTWTLDSIRYFVLTTIDLFGADRCMFASNAPVDLMYRDPTELWNSYATLTADATPAERAKMFRDNACEVYRI